MRKVKQSWFMGALSGHISVPSTKGACQGALEIAQARGRHQKVHVHHQYLLSSAKTL